MPNNVNGCDGTSANLWHLYGNDESSDDETITGTGWDDLCFDVQKLIAGSAGLAARYSMSYVNRSMRKSVEHTTSCLGIYERDAIAILKDSRRFPALRSLRLCNIEAIDLACLPKGITDLNLCDSPNASTSEGLSYLRNMSLKKLDLSYGCQHDELTVFDFAELQLTNLEVRCIPMHDDCIANISSISTLQHLFLPDSHIKQSGIAMLSNNLQLLSLDLSYNEVGAEGIAALAKMSNLSTLIVKGADISDECTTSIVAMSSLTRLNLLHNQHFSIDGLLAIAKKTSLRSLAVELRNAPADGVFQALKDNSTLTELKLTQSNIGDGDLFNLWNKTTLKKLTLKHAFVTADGIERLSPSPSLHTFCLLKNYRSIGMIGAAALTRVAPDALIFDITTPLEKSFLTHSVEQLEALGEARDIRKIEQLTLTGLSFNNLHILLIPEQIKVLTLRHCAVTASGLKRLYTPHLTTLNLFETAMDVDREALQNLLPTLQTISVKHQTETDNDEEWQRYGEV